MADYNNDVHTLTSFDLHPPVEKENVTVLSKLLKKVKFSLLPNISPKSSYSADSSSSVGSLHSVSQPESIKLVERVQTPLLKDLTLELEESVPPSNPSENKQELTPTTIPTESKSTLSVSPYNDVQILTKSPSESNLDSLPSLKLEKHPSIKSTVSSQHRRSNSILSLIGKLKGSDYSKDYWMQDDNCKECYDCKVPFNTFRRKHHCRACGQIFCYKCASRLIQGELFNSTGYLRVCNYCLDEHRDNEESSTSDAYFNTQNIIYAPMLPPATTITKPPRRGARPISVYSINLLSGDNQRKRASSMGIPISYRVDETSSPVIIGSPAPFRKDLDQNDKASVAVLTGAYCDPEIAEYLQELDDTISLHAETVGSGSLSNLFLPISSDINDKVSLEMTSEDDTWTEYGISQTNSRLPRPIKGSTNGPYRNSNDSLNFHRQRNTLMHPLSSYTRSPNTGRRSLKLFRGKKSRKPMVSSTFSNIDTPAHVELSAACLTHMKCLLRQVLIHEQISLESKWEEVLMSLLLKVSNTVNLDMKNGHDMDIRHCVKIKKVPGATPQKSLYINGFVCTKNLGHKKMQKVIQHPRILILSFSVEYQRVENQFISLDTIITQEKEHLQHLVQRIVALNPSIVLVEKTVSRIALDFLLEEGITVILNVKASVIESVSRFCRGDILSSIDKLSLSPILGECEKFSVQTFRNPLLQGAKKSLLFFEGCSKEIGCSIILRGENLEILAKIKVILKFMLLVVHNLKLETFLLRDHFAKTPVFMDQSSAVITSPTGNDTFSSFPLFRSEYTDILTKFDTTILSMSPRVKFPLPYLLMKIKEDKIKIADYSKEGGLFSTDSHDYQLNCLDFFVLSTCKKEEEIGNDSKEKFCWTFEPSAEAQSGLDNLQANEALLSPLSHQNLIVLKSTICILDGISTLCQDPQILRFEYYQSFDVPLGGYVEDFCYDANLRCNTCRGLGLNHIKTYTHGNGNIRVTIEKSPCASEGMDNVILMWSVCKVCGYCPPLIPMSEETWKYSLGKYLELLFYLSDMNCRTSECAHLINRHHIRYFGFKNFAVKFVYEEIKLFEVTVPPLKLRDHPHIRAKICQEERDLTAIKIIKYYDSITERLKRFPFENVYPEKLDECKHEILELDSRSLNEKRIFLQALENQALDVNSDVFSINSLRFKLTSYALQWDRIFNTLAKAFIQPDRTAKKFGSALVKKNQEDAGLESGKMNVTPIDIARDPLIPVINRDDDAPNEVAEINVVPKLAISPSLSTYEAEQNDVDPADILVSGIISTPGEQGDAKILSPQQKRRLSIQMMHDSKVMRNRAKLATPIGIALSDSSDICHSSVSPCNETRMSELTRPSSIEFDHALPSSSAIMNQTDSDILPASPKLISRQQSLSLADYSDIAFSIEKLFEEVVDDPLYDEDNVCFTDDSDREIIATLTRANTTDEYISREEMEDNFSLTAQPFGRISTMSSHKMDLSRSVDKPVLSEFLKDNLENIQGNFIKTSPSQGGSTILEEPKNESESVAQYIYNKLPRLNLTESQSDLFVGDGPASVPSPTPERNSIMKAIANMWAQATPDYVPLEYPFTSSEHFFHNLNPCVIVRDDEPGSIISVSLSSVDYKKRLMTLKKEDESNPTYGKSSPAFELFAASEIDSLKDMDEREATLLFASGSNIQYKFNSSHARFYCKIHFARQFDALRSYCGSERSFLTSLERCFKWDSLGGKSGSTFLKTRDERLIIKEVSRLEMDAFLKFAPKYFAYVSKAMFHKLPTVMTKIFGIFSIRVQNLITGKSIGIDVIVMENLFYQRRISKVFDLKGSKRNRFAQSTGKRNEVLLDENLLQFMEDCPLYIREHSQKYLVDALCNDTLFLYKQNVMDYSLLLGIDEENQELVVGIVDIIRTYTWDKKLESWVKETGLLGGPRLQPTIISPKQYKNRFRKAMFEYFMMVPDKFCNWESVQYQQQKLKRD